LSNRFASRTAIVTGGGSGIGRVIAQRFAAEGAAVVVADWGAETAPAVAAEIEAAGGRALATHTDVSRGADVAAMHEAAVSAFGSVDVLVNNAAIADADGVLETDEAEWDRELAVVLKSAFLCSKAVLPGMLERGRGVIVNIATVNAYSFLANEAYSAAKAGLVNLTQSIAVRYGHAGVRCVAIAPGTIRTPVWQARVDKRPEIFERLRRWYPLDRVGEPEDVANAALFLASDEASWITGTVLRVDGGLLAGSAQMARELVADFGGDSPEGAPE
jgi:meso-butanediol dehydrogenase / (S,S)-butanediol dehydrogenase / diacetyl reductase